jgi:TetR/AcrR family transcriptional regulator, regulator of biofilm formation and stress response
MPANQPAGYWALLRAVPRVVARVGLRGLTYRAVAKNAGVTYGLVSYYFGSRDAMIEAATQLATGEAIARAKLVPSSGSVHDFATGISKLLVEAPDDQAFQYELVCEARRSKALQPAVKEMYENYVGAVSASLDNLGIKHDEALARMIFATLDGIVLQQLVYDDEKMTDDTVAALQRVLVTLSGSRRKR